jgi:hypothetical protein
MNPTIQPGFGGGGLDAFLTELAPDLSIVQSGYLGGNGGESGEGVGVDTLGNVYVVGGVGSSDFPITPGVFQPTLNGTYDAFVLKVPTKNTRASFQLDWVAPDPASPDLNPAPRGLTVRTGVAPAGAANAATPRAGSLIGYNVYRSTTPGATASSATFYTSLPPDQTSTGQTAAGGGFFVVTAVYDTGESGPTNEGSGDGGEGTIASVTVKSAKIVVKGSRFTSTAAVFVDGLPFVSAAKVKNGTKVNQKGTLLTGQSVSAYLDANGGTAVVSVRNSNGGTATFRVSR